MDMQTLSCPVESPLTSLHFGKSILAPFAIQFLYVFVLFDVSPESVPLYYVN